MLATDTDAPVVTQTTVSADLLQALKVLTELSIDLVSKSVGSLAVRRVALTVQKPNGNLEVLRLLENADDALKLLNGELSGTVKLVSSPFSRP